MSMKIIMDIKKAFSKLGGDNQATAEVIKAQAAEIEALKAKNAAAEKTIVDLVAECETLLAKYAALTEEVANLKARLNMNSRNSSKPPSTDGPFRPRPKSLRPKTGRSTGGQPGHVGRTLEMAEPTRAVNCVPPICDCGHCGDRIEEVIVEKRQTHGVEIRKVVVEYRKIKSKCAGCGKISEGAFPPTVKAPVQYDDSVAAIANAFMEENFIPFKRLSGILGDIFKCPVSEGTLGKMRGRLFERLDAPVEAIRDMAPQVPGGKADETGFRDNGRLRWLHCFCAPELVHFHVADSRGAASMAEGGILDKFTGKLVHDHHKSYYLFDQCVHTACNTHVLRELVFIHEEIAEQRWADRMIGLLLEAKGAVDAAKAVGERMLSDNMLDTIEGAYDRIVDEGFAANPPKPVAPNAAPKRGRRAKPKQLNLLCRLRQRKQEHLEFIHDFDVPFDNNEAERVLRPEKTRQKISGTTRGPDSARVIARIRSYLVTAKRNGLSAYEAIRLALRGEAFVPIRN